MKKHYLEKEKCTATFLDSVVNEWVNLSEHKWFRLSERYRSGEVTRENASQIEGSLAEIKDEVQRAQQNYSKLLSIVTNEHHGCSDLLTQRFISEVASDLSRLANMSQALDHFPAPQPREVQS